MHQIHEIDFFSAIPRTRLKDDIRADSFHVTCIRSFVKIGRLVRKLKRKHLLARALTLKIWKDNEDLYPSRILNPDPPVVQTAAQSLHFTCSGVDFYAINFKIYYILIPRQFYGPLTVFCPVHPTTDTF